MHWNAKCASIPTIEQMATDPRPSDSIIESCNFYLAHSQKKKHVGFTKSESYKSQLLPSAQPPDTTFQGLIRLKPTASITLHKPVRAVRSPKLVRTNPVPTTQSRASRSCCTSAPAAMDAWVSLLTPKRSTGLTDLDAWILQKRQHLGRMHVVQ